MIERLRAVLFVILLVLMLECKICIPISYNNRRSDSVCQDAAARVKALNDVTFRRDDCVSYLMSQVHLRKGFNRPQFHLIMYFTDNIDGHSALSFAINYLYVLAHNSAAIENGGSLSLSRYLPTSEEGKIVEDWDVFDVRWNKVIILYNLISDLLDRNITTEDNQYLVWLDSDLIVANHSFSFHDEVHKIAAYRQVLPDIILSREVNPDNGIANTGCMLLRVSPWTKSFLWRWWNGWNRQEGMDQHVFEALYHQLPHEEQEHHLCLLGISTINSEFPGLVNHRLAHPILHLAGESNFVRREIFQSSFTALCNYLTRNDKARTVINEDDTVVVYPPFGVSRAALNEIDYRAAHQFEWNSILEELRQATEALPADIIDVRKRKITMDGLKQWQYRIREAQQSLGKFLCSNVDGISIAHVAGDSNSSCVPLKDLFYQEAVEALSRIYRAYRALMPVDIEGSDDLLLGQATLDAALELLTILRYDEPVRSDHNMTPASQTETPSLSLYARIIVELEAMLQRMMVRCHRSGSSSSSGGANVNEKVLKYYEYKAAEYYALYIEDQHQTVGTVTVLDVISAWERTMDVWRDMAERLHYFGTGNGVAHAYDEGIAIAMRLANLLCSTSPMMFSTASSRVDYLSVGNHAVVANPRHRGRIHLRWILGTPYGSHLREMTRDRGQVKYGQEWQYLSTLCGDPITVDDGDSMPDFRNSPAVEWALTNDERHHQRVPSTTAKKKSFRRKSKTVSKA